ncbi:mitochondrial inner membrane protein required for protein import [Conglomerata obtusa]
MGLNFFCFRKGFYNKNFPIISSSILASGIAIYILGKPKKDQDTSPSSYIKRATENILDKISVKKIIPTLPSQERLKPVILFDLDGFLTIRKFLYPATYKRPYTGVFLFHLAHTFEIVLLSSTSYTDSNLLKKIDPYGCISYRLYLKDKDDFKINNLNRDLRKTIYISTNILKNDFENNTIILDKWNGEKDNKLIKLLNFCTDLERTDVNDWRKIIISYKNKDFFKEYEKIKLNRYKNSAFVWDYKKKYLKNEQVFLTKKVNDFYKAKLEMDQHLMRDELSQRKNNFFTMFRNLCISFL